MSRRILCSLALLLSMFATLVPGVASVSAQTDLAEGTYVDPNFAFSVTWDPDVFEGEEIVGDEDPFGVTLTAAGVFGQIWAGDFASTRACINGLTGDFADIEGVSNFEESSELELPETDPDARAEVYSYDYENPDTGDEGTWAHYFECRDLLVEGEPVEDVVLAISIDIAFDDYDTIIRDIEDVLGSIEYDATGGGSDNGGDNGRDNGGGGEAGLGDGTFIEPVFLWGMSWDPDAYDAEEILTEDDELYGVTLSGPGIYAQFFSGGYASTRACLNALVDNLEGFDGVSNFEEADDLGLPETDPDARAGMYRYDFENADGEESSWARYFECREILIEGEPVEDAILAISIDFAEDEYDTVIDDFEPILASIEFDAAGGGGNGGDNGGDNGGGGELEPGVNGNVYLDPQYGFTVTWNDRDFTGENWDPEESGDIVGLQLVAESGGFMTLFVQEASSVRSCTNGRADELSGGAFNNFEEVDLELPEATDGTRQAIWQGIFTNSEGDESDIILYSQCSPIIAEGEEVEDVFLAVDLIASPAEYEDLIPALSEVLTSIEFDAANGGSSSGNDPEEDPNNDPGEDPTPDPDEEVESGIAGGTYTSSLGYSISWDDSIYSAELLDEENPDLGISISSENSFMVVQVAGDPTLEACVEAEADIVAGLNGISDFGTSRLDGPEPGRGAESATYGASLELSNGDARPVFIYIQCTELGEVEGNTLAVIVRMIGFEDTYEDELPLWQETIDSLEIA